MRHLIFSLAALAFCVASAQADDRFCGGANFSDGPTLRIGQIAADAPRVAFVRNGDLDIRCPSVEPGCRDKAFLVARDLVVIGRRLDEFVCADYWTAKSARSGWLPAIALAPAKVSVNPADWSGDWTRVEAEIKIINTGGVLKAQGSATYGALDPDRVKRGGVNLGEFSGPLVLADGQATFADKDVDPSKPDSFGCRVRLALAGDSLFVQDNGQCGGANVSFTGLYRRAGK
ncbi:hypothetical protein [uncultured Rhodoblastus sp.]|uniref:hypothetical protein n=1 Tax=uncultured Rhodoblastus sp. TaxID=543037 RepID=UPI0025E42A59|nr:hypothetical protein [uncultured Rhodoblastus sp.]